MKERIDMMNKMAIVNFDMAKGMLKMFNDIYGTDYKWNNRRVVYVTADGHIHDAWVNA